MRRDERGYIVVETVLCFTLFVFLMISILSLINIVTVQARIHYAMTETAKTVSMYCYALEKMGIAEQIMKSDEIAEKGETEIDTFKDNLNGILDAVNGFSEANSFEDYYKIGEELKEPVKGMVDQGKNLKGTDPKELLRSFMNLGTGKIAGQGFEWILQRLMIRYLSNGEMDGDTYLRTFGIVDGIKGLDFAAVTDIFDMDITKNTDSKPLTKDGDVRLIVKYEIDYAFGALPLPFNKIKVTQEVITKAWLKGDGEGYKAK